MSKRVGYIIASIISAVTAVLFFVGWMAVNAGSFIANSWEWISWPQVCINFFANVGSADSEISNVSSMIPGGEGMMSSVTSALTAAKLIAAAILILIALSIIFFAIYIIKGAVLGRKHKKWGIMGALFAMILAIVTICIPMIISGLVKSSIESTVGSDMMDLVGSINMVDISGMISSVFKITPIPYVVLVLSVLNLIFMNALDKGSQPVEYGGYNAYGGYENNGYTDNGYDNNSYAGGGYEDNNSFETNNVAPSEGEKFCPACGEKNFDYAKFCKKCGFNFDNETNGVSSFNEPETVAETAAETAVETPSKPETKNVEWNKASDMLDLSGSSSKSEDDDNNGNSLKINM